MNTNPIYKLIIFISFTWVKSLLKKQSLLLVSKDIISCLNFWNKDWFFFYHSVQLSLSLLLYSQRFRVRQVSTTLGSEEGKLCRRLLSDSILRLFYFYPTLSCWCNFLDKKAAKELYEKNSNRSYLPTLPLGQNMTQGQFLSGGLNSDFSFS